MDGGYEAQRKLIREKALKFGSLSLSEAELIGLILSSCGAGGGDAGALADELLEHYGGLVGLLEADPAELGARPGLDVNTARLLTLIPELCRRQKAARHSDITLTSSYSAERYVGPLFMLDRGKQVTRILCLNSCGAVRGIYRLDKRPLQLTEEDINGIARYVAEKNAVSVVFAHSLAGAIPETRETKAMLRVMNVLKLMRVRLYDYIVVTSGGAASSTLNTVLMLDPCCPTVMS